MSKFPLFYPNSDGVNGPGRYLELCSYRRDISDKYEANFTKLFNHTTSKFFLRRQTLYAPDANEADTVVVAADWTSRAERDAFSNHPDLTAAADAFPTLLNRDKPEAVVYHFDLPTGPARTPAAGWYVACYMRCPVAKQPALAAAFDAYLRGIFSCEKFNPVFAQMAVSREDPEMVLSLQGWKTKEDADKYMVADEHMNFVPAVQDLMTVPYPVYQAALKPYTSTDKTQSRI